MLRAVQKYCYILTLARSDHIFDVFSEQGDLCIEDQKLEKVLYDGVLGQEISSFDVVEIFHED
jgi:hypothetical protein